MDEGGGPALDDDVVARAGQGDAVAIEAIYVVLAPKVMGYLHARGADDAEALTNDVFVAVLPRLPGLRGGEDGLRRLVFSVAHHRYVDGLRRRRRRPTQVPLEPQEDQRPVASAEDQALDALALDRFRGALAALTTDQAAVLALRVFGDLSLEATAETLGRSVGAVKQLQRRGLECLRSNLTEGGDEDV